MAIRPTLIDDSGALICGFLVRRGEAAGRIERLDEAIPLLSRQNAPPDTSAWLHLNLSDMRTRNWLRDTPHLPHDVRQLMLDDNEHVRIGPVGDGIGGMLGDLSYDTENEPDRIHTLVLYVNEHVMLTGRRHPLKVTDQLRKQMEGGFVSDGRAFPVLVYLLDDLADLYDAVAARVSGAIDDFEDRILDDRHLEVSEPLGRLHRVLTRLRRHVAADRAALARAAGQLPAWCNPDDQHRFKTVADRFESLVSDLSSEQDRARLLQEDIARRVNESTNRNLYFLSIVTAIFLPITLVSGIFGMNVPDLPWDQTRGGFWVVIVVMLCTVGITLLVLRWRRII